MCHVTYLEHVGAVIKINGKGHAHSGFVCSKSQSLPTEEEYMGTEPYAFKNQSGNLLEVGKFITSSGLDRDEETEGKKEDE